MRNFDYKKSLGQNFLKDINVIDKIANASDVLKNNLVIEIGPGAGALSMELVKKYDKVLMYEIDLMQDKPFRIIANLPYYITTPIILKIIKENLPIKEMVIMIQKEVAERFTAIPGSREYGQITVFLQYFFEMEKVCNVSKNSFVPKPKVDSSVLRMRKRDNLLYLKYFNHFEKLVRDSFRFKRKTIKNNLGNYDLDKIDKVLFKYGYSINSRSEELSYNVFVDISNELCK